MRLTQARVLRFKSVTDSTPFAIDPMVTALVGKNESGKTAVLQAMYRLRPIASGHPTDFEELRDDPRRYRSRDRDSIPDTEPVQLTFHLNDLDHAAIERRFGEGASLATEVRVARKYGDATTWWLGQLIDEGVAVRHLLSEYSPEVRDHARDTLLQTLPLLEADDSDDANRAHEALDGRDLQAEARHMLALRLPRFQYFDEYNILPGSVSILRLQNTDEADLEADERTALSLLRLAGVADEEFTEDEYESRKAALEAAANSLTDELFEYWTQNEELEVELDIEFRRNTSTGQTEPWLQIRVRNRKHRVTLNMAERSKGFIWFFSFLAAFSELAGAGRRIILLDEPGLNLHARAQADLLRFIEERVAPHHQVIYSTHSLFMIDPDHLERCRTVEDFGDDGTVVSQDIWRARPETVFPLLGALGVDLTQTLILGPDQLLVEGPSEVAYLSVMSDLLREAGRTPLDPRWTLTPVGGIDKVPSFIALMGGSDLRVAVLMDVAPGGNQRVANMVDRGLLDERRLIPVTRYTGGNEGDIEDLFERDWYLKLLKQSKVGTVAKSKVKGTQRIVKQVEVALNDRYDHYQPASFLLRSGSELRSEINDETQDRFDRLFADLNALLE